MATIERFPLVGLVLIVLALPLIPSRVEAQSALAAQRHAREGFRLAQEGTDLGRAESEFREAVRLDPSNTAYLSALGGVLAVQEKYGEAGDFFKKALDLRPYDLAIRRNLAAAQWQSGYLELARANLDRILRVQPRDQPSVLLLGIVASESNDCDRALPMLESVVPLVRARPEAGVALAKCYYQTGSPGQGREALGHLLVNPAAPANLLRGAEVAAGAKDFETALRLFSSLRGAYEDRPTLEYNIAYCQYRAGRFRESRETLRALVNQEQLDSDVFSLIGWTHQAEGQLDEAIPAFRSAIEAAPLEESNHLDLAMALMDSKKHPAALSIAQTALEALPDSFALFQMRGVLETTLGHYTDAVVSYGRAVQLNPDSPEANLNLALAQSAAGDKGASRETLRSGIDRFPGHAPHYLEYGRLLLDLCMTGADCDDERAGLLFREAIELDHESAEAWYEAGMLALEQGSYDEAASHLETASRVNPIKSKVALALARAYIRLGRSEAAARERRRFRALKEKEDLANPRYYTQRRTAPTSLFQRGQRP